MGYTVVMETNPDKCPKVIDEALGKDFTNCEERAAKVTPADIAPAITEEQFESLQNNTGIYNVGRTNCDDLKGELLCDIRQDLEFVLQNRVMNIFANDFSKCSDDDDSPTLASMWSRLYRFSSAVTAILCSYDPFIATLLKAGRYPQILMGAVQAGGYPQWVNPDDVPTQDSEKPVTSGGVYEAIQAAIMSVWHKWEEHPDFTYYAENLTMLGMQDDDAEEGDTAIIKDGSGTKKNVIYTYDGSGWVEGETLGVDGPDNFAVTHIKKGEYENKDIYYFKDDIHNEPTWNLLNAHLAEIEAKVELLEKEMDNMVYGNAPDEHYLLTTRKNLTDALAVPVTAGKTTITLITG